MSSTREFEGAAVLEGFPNTWKRVMTDPRGFFADMPEVGGLQAPLAFLGVSAVISAAGHLVMGWGLGGFLRIVLWQVLGAFVSAALFVLVAQHLFGGRAGFEPTFRVVAYAAAPMVLSWLPWRLGVLAVLYGAYLTIVGLERVVDRLELVALAIGQDEVDLSIARVARKVVGIHPLVLALLPSLVQLGLHVAEQLGAHLLQRLARFLEECLTHEASRKGAAL